MTLLRTFADKRATVFDCADVLLQVNGTSAQCCVAVKETAYGVAIL